MWKAYGCSTPSFFSTFLDGVPYQFLGNRVENGRFFLSENDVTCSENQKNVDFGSLTKKNGGFWHLPRAPPLRSEFSKIRTEDNGIMSKHITSAPGGAGAVSGRGQLSTGMH